ncbi:unnamed protein product [Cuscuta campestris]|uniref:CCHC-type domain-containing protein n=1 Tax=Cuscuta campestris TaxID=132261 RepID=A0A484KSP6_9ASTE|nr:unnamed protein product [Cuscuta campestris]
MVVSSSPLPFGSSVGATTMTSFSMPSSIFGSAPRPIPGLETTGDYPVGNSNPFLGPTMASALTVILGPNAGFPTPVNLGPNAGFPTLVNPFVGPHWATNGPFLHTPNAVGPISVPARSVQRPPKFNGTNFKMWQQKMMFFMTVLGFAEYLQQDPPQPNETNNPLVAMVNQAWYHNNYLAINIILEGLGDSLYPVYAGAKLAKELWNSLNKKYQAEDAGTKKFIVGKMLDYKMVDSKSVVAQAEELTVIFNKCNEEKVGVSEAFQVAAIIHKLPRSWEDFQADLKLKKTELNLEQLLTRLRIREEGLARRSGGAKANVVEHPSGSTRGGKDKKKMGPKGGVSKFAGKCYNCGITRHRSSDCRKKKPQKGKKKPTEAMCAELDNLDLCAVVTEARVRGGNCPGGVARRLPVIAAAATTATATATPAAVAASTATAGIPAASAVAAAISAVKSAAAAAPRPAVAAASVSRVSAARMSAAAAGAEEGCGRLAGAIDGVGLLLFDEEKSGPNFQEGREWILVLQKLNLTPDVVRKALKNLEYKSMFGDRSIHVVQVLGEILEKTTIFVDGELALDSYLALKRSSKRSKKSVVMASPIRRSGRLQLAEIMKRPKVHAAHVDLGDDEEDSVEDGEKGRILATTIIDLVSLIESAPPGTMENDVFKQLQLAAGRLLGLAQRRGGGSLETPEGGFSEVTYDEGFWSDPANIDQLIANEQAVLARSKYKKIMEDMPSFSLGFSQLDGENENVNIDGGDMGACRNTPRTPAVRVVNEPESNPGVENDFITPGEVQFDRDLDGGSRIQPDMIGMTAVAGVSAVGDGTVRGTVTECSKAVVRPCNAARKLARTLKPASPLRSPYLTRPIDLSDGLSVMERRVTNWVLQNPNAPKDEAVFVKDGLELTRGEIASLDIGKHISKREIDVWSTILNHNEKFKSDESPLRVFARSMDCVVNGNIVDVSEANVKNMFANALLPAWDDMADDFNWGKAELFFFPIMQQNWAYVLCVDLKSRRCDILDSSSTKAKNEDRYGDMPKRVVRLLGDFLEQQRFVYKGKCVREMLAKRITFPWRDPKATFDYGVATMRHMETYMGDGGKGWNSGLSKINQKPMMLLRCKYCACILLSPVNALLDKVYAESEKLERERKGKDP